MSETTTVPALIDKPGNPRPWYYAAIILAGFAILALIAGFAFVVNADGLQAKVHRSQMLAPFGLALLAMVTFCTVVWRGLISAHQLEQQAKQLEHQAKQLEHQAQQLMHQSDQLEQQRLQVRQQIRQNDANENSNLAKLLQEGAKLIADPEKTAEVRAGIATLEILLTEPNKRFGVQAMDLLAEYVKENFEKEALEGSVNTAISSLEIGENNGLRSRVRAELHLPMTTPRPTWRYIPGFQRISYFGGAFRNTAFSSATERRAHFENVAIIGAHVPIRSYKNCTFKSCTFDKVDTYTLRSNEFLDCDFSGAEIDDFIEEIDAAFVIKGSGNYYDAGKPPVGPKLDWSKVFSRRAKVKTRPRRRSRGESG